jgi:hypothetical protein
MYTRLTARFTSNSTRPCNGGVVRQHRRNAELHSQDLTEIHGRNTRDVFLAL